MDDILIAKKEIGKLLSDFIEDPDNNKTQLRAIEVERKYAGLCTLNDYKKEKIVPDLLMTAISFVQEIYPYGYGTYNKEDSLKKAKEILKTLE